MCIRDRPYPQLMHSGNDPVRMFRELADLGELSVRADTGRLPRLAELRPEDCHLAWDLELRGAVPREAVAEVFAWVEGDCDLRIEPLKMCIRDSCNRFMSAIRPSLGPC